MDQSSLMARLPTFKLCFVISFLFLFFEICLKYGCMGVFKVVLDSLFMQVAIINHLNIDWQSEDFLLCFPDLWFF
jgi:hypothetical protein